MNLGRYAIRITYANGERAYVRNVDDQRKRYHKRRDAEIDKAMLEEMAGSRAVCQSDYIPPQYRIVRLA